MLIGSIRVSAAMHAERPLYNVYDCCVFMDQSVNPANAHLTPTCTSKAVSVTKDPEGLHICAFRTSIPLDQSLQF
jgi:hypothetical protein